MFAPGAALKWTTSKAVIQNPASLPNLQLVMTPRTEHPHIPVTEHWHPFVLTMAYLYWTWHDLYWTWHYLYWTWHILVTVSWHRLVLNTLEHICTEPWHIVYWKLAYLYWTWHNCTEWWRPWFVLRTWHEFVTEPGIYCTDTWHILYWTWHIVVKRLETQHKLWQVCPA